MSFADLYLKKQGYKTQIKELPSKNVRFIAVIPCCNEPFLLKSLGSLNNCRPPKSGVEVIVVINSSGNASDAIQMTNLETLKSLEKWIIEEKSFFKTYILFFPDLPKKYAGAGMARKIGMDEAIYRFNLINNEDGVIISFDSDSVCDPNYFVEIEDLYIKKPETNGCSVYFEHPVEGHEFEETVYNGIILYELYLRYYIQALRYIGYPHAFHTIGSCFTVKANTYVKQGGMNRRIAGEDFYFLHKIFPLGNYYDLNSTRVIPSPRPSDRVPFGTGPFINKYIRQQNRVVETYNIEAFEDIRCLLLQDKEFFQTELNKINKTLSNLPARLQEYLCNIKFSEEILRINRNCTSIEAFVRHFYFYFNAFKILKYLNFVHEKKIKKSDLITSAVELLKKMGFQEISQNSKELLILYRKIEKNQHYEYSFLRNS